MSGSPDTSERPIEAAVELRHLRRQRDALASELARVYGERDKYLNQLGVVQAECTRLVLVQRALRQDLVPLAERLVEARAKHPEGTTLEDLLDEVDELEYARANESAERVKCEALDVAVCGLRLALDGDRQ